MRKGLHILALATVLAVSCAREIAPELPAKEAQESIEGDCGLIPGSIKIKFSEEIADMLDQVAHVSECNTKAGLLSAIPATKAEGLTKAIEALDMYRLTRIFPDGGEFEPRHREAGLHQWYIAEYSTEFPQTKATQILEVLPGVELVTESRKIEQNAVNVPFNDPGAKAYQWHLLNDGSLNTKFKKGADVDCVPAWNNYTTGDSDVIVAVIDVGVDLNHPDLKNICIPQGENGSRNFIYAYSSEPYVVHAESHGTHVASIIAAINNNGIGVCGIAGGGSDGKGGVRILSCNALATDPNDSSKGLSGNTDNALVWAADHGAVIANNSWSYVYDSEDKVPSNSSYSLITIHSAIDYFIRNAGTDKNGNQTGPMKGGIVLFSAGNKNWAKGQPAMYDNVIAVGATGPANEKASYSTYGDWVDVCAPGGNYSPYGNQISEIYACTVNSGYTFMQGTSMSCPAATGVVALLVSYFKGPGLTPEKIRKRLIEGANTSVQASHPNPIGPLVDAYKSLSYDEGTLSQVKDLKWTSDTESITLNWTAQAYGSITTPEYIAYLSNNKSLIDFLNVNKVPSTVKSIRIDSKSMEVGATIEAKFEGLKPATSYYCTVVASNTHGKYSALANTLTAKTAKANEAPVLNTENPGPFTLTFKDKVSTVFTATDETPATLKAELTTGSSAAKWTASGTGEWTLNINGAGAAPGSYTATITVSDEEGLSASASVDYTIATNLAPVFSTPVPESLSVPWNGSASSEISVSDPDGDKLTVTYEAPAGAAWSDLGNGRYRLTVTGKDAPAGTYKATISATDGNLSSNAEISYTILENHAPAFTAANPASLTVKKLGTGSSEISVSDPDGDKLTVTYEAPAGAVWSSLGEGKYRLTVTGKDAPAGTYKATISATDGNLSSSAEISYTILENHAPAFTAASPASLTVKKLATGSSEISVSDPDGDKLTVTYETPAGAAWSDLGNGRYRLTVTGKDAPAGTYKAKITATDGDLSSSAEISYTILENHAPVFTAASPASITVKKLGTGSSEISVSDPDGDKLTVSYNAPAGATWSSLGNGKYQLTVTGKDTPAGTYKAKITATDGDLSSSAEISYTVLENQAPRVTAEIGDQVLSTSFTSPGVMLDKYFTDDDGEKLSYSCTVSGSSVKASTGGSILDYSCVGTGVATITVTATDSFGATASQSFRILACDTKELADLYPIPVKTKLNIRPREDSSIKATVTGSNGTVLFKGDVHGGPFEPATIDMTKMAPGTYNIKLEIGGKVLSRSILKN